MTMVYVSFCKPVNFDTATALIRTCREVVSDGQHNWDKLRLMISSGGGNITAAFAAYNEIRSMPIELETLNTGATDSPALMIFMAGKKRYACARSAFQLRQPSWWFQSKDDVALSVISDAARWLQEYQQMMAEAIAEGTDGQLTRDKVVEMIQTGTTLNPQQAKDIGLIHDIIEPTIPAGARWWQA
jgi:ATP-dependent Clp protease, protease subunit